MLRLQKSADSAGRAREKRWAVRFAGVRVRLGLGPRHDFERKGREGEGEGEEEITECLFVRSSLPKLFASLRFFFLSLLWLCYIVIAVNRRLLRCALELRKTAGRKRR